MYKYNNKKIVIDNIKFDSVKESEYYLILKDKEKNNEISNLRLQVKYELIPNQKENNKVIHRAINYKADFVYQDKDNVEHIVDVKSPATLKDKVFKLKEKLFYYRYKKNIEIVLTTFI